MQELYLSAIFGAIGGVTRAFVGLLKHRIPRKVGKFHPKELLFTPVASAVIGLFCGLLIATNFAIEFIKYKNKPNYLLNYRNEIFISSNIKEKKEQFT